jgi:hypothetical protein
LQLSSAMQMLHPPCWCPIPISGVRGTGGRHRVPGGGGAGGMGRWHWGSPGVMISHRCFPVVGRFLRAFANCARAQWEHVPPPRTPTCNIMQQFQILIHSGVFVTLQIIVLLGPSRCLYRLTKLFRHIQLSDLCSAWVEYLHITCKIYRDIYIYIYIWGMKQTPTVGSCWNYPSGKFSGRPYFSFQAPSGTAGFLICLRLSNFPRRNWLFLFLPCRCSICLVPFILNQQWFPATYLSKNKCQIHFQQQWLVDKHISNNNGLLWSALQTTMASC